MKKLVTIISLLRSGQIIVDVLLKDKSDIDIILSNTSCESIDLMVSDVLIPTIEEVKMKVEIRSNEMIILLPKRYAKITENRGCIFRDSPMEEISRKEVSFLLKNMRKIHPFPESKIINIASLFYSVDDKEIKYTPVGICGRVLEGKFRVLFGNKILINQILNNLNSTGIIKKKFIPANISSAKPFLNAEENEILSRLTHIK